MVTKRGYTLIELLVYSTLSLLVLVNVFGFFVTMTRFTRGQQAKVDARSAVYDTLARIRVDLGLSQPGGVTVGAHTLLVQTVDSVSINQELSWNPRLVCYAWGGSVLLRKDYEAPQALAVASLSLSSSAPAAPSAAQLAQLTADTLSGKGGSSLTDFSLAQLDPSTVEVGLAGLADPGNPQSVVKVQRCIGLGL